MRPERAPEITRFVRLECLAVGPWYVLPDEFLVSGDRGAAGVLGVTTASYAQTERWLGERLLPRLVQPGATVGDALLGAKQQLAADGGGGLRDVILGWTLLGDPAAVVQP